jgi:peptidoglycan/LPS O-acetylase OafA/YrhL
MTDHDPDISEPLASLVRHAVPLGFGDGFAERVATRIEHERATSLSSALERQFLRIVPAVAAATMLFAAYNWWGAHATTASMLDAALDLPQVTLSSAYAPATLFGVANTLTDVTTP